MTDPAADLLDPAAAADEPELDRTLRPRRLDEFVGQAPIREQLTILVDAARRREEPLEHCVFSGPPGLGKTTLATILAAEMGVQLRVSSGPAIEHQGVLASVLTNLGARDVLFIDEIHRLQRGVEESLYPAMEDFAFDFATGKGAGAQSLRLRLQPFTVVGATTRLGLLSGPLRDRFGAAFRLDFYTPGELATILRRSARLLAVEVEPAAIVLLAERARGTPRIANRLLRRVRDFALVRADGRVTAPVATEALAMLEVDALGLDAVDRRLLRAICEHFGGGPVGLDTVAVSLAEEAQTIEDVHEPFLIQAGLLARTQRGRVATPRAYQHLGLAAPPTAAPAGAPGGPGEGPTLFEG
ncbi:MAG TPA: Holliday junction branch migration DNA helicase RuvB [Candidatus Micrarchaeia archaeon]|nr:Holliday junction branch migration DNA helicase RuvB [Candidatus Micrarchaeia archaeon]